MNRHRLTVCSLLLGVLCLTGVPTGAQEKPAPPTSDAKETVAKAAPAEAPFTVTTLKGGTRLIVLRDPDAPVVVTDVFFNVNRFDERRWPGINALIARTWGVESEWRGAALTRRDVSRIGSAGTDVSDDWVEIWAVSGKDATQVSDSLRTLLTNLVANPRFSVETLQTAKEDQQQARELASDAVVSDALAILRGRIWGATPRGGSLLGSPDALVGLTPEALTAYYRERFRPNRCVICIVGNVEPEQIAQKVTNAMGAGEWLSGPPAPPVKLPAPETLPGGLRDRVLGRTAPAQVLMTGYIAPGTAPVSSGTGDGARREGGAEEYAKLLLLDAALTGGKSSRLFTTLRDMPGTDQAPLGYDLRSVVQAGPVQSLWAIYAVGITPLGEARSRLRTALQQVATDAPLTDDEINRARAWLKVNHARERQRPRDRATGAAWAEVMGLGAGFDVRFDAALDAVTTDDVNRLARRVLGSPSAVVYSQYPEAPAPPPTEEKAP